MLKEFLELDNYVKLTDENELETFCFVCASSMKLNTVNKWWAKFGICDMGLKCVAILCNDPFKNISCPSFPLKSFTSAINLEISGLL